MKYLSIILLSLFASAAVAQPVRWDIEQCMRYAVENSPQTAIQRAQNEIHKQNYREAIGQILPSIAAGTNANFSFGRGLDAETNTYTDINSFSNNYGINASVVLFNGFAGINQARMQKINTLMGKQDLQKTMDDLAYATMEAFFNVQYYKEMVALAEEQLAESAGSLRRIERMAELGLKGAPDLAEMRAKEAADSYNLTRQRNILNIGIIILKEKMNFPIADQLDIVEYAPDGVIAKSDMRAMDVYERAIDFLPVALTAQSSVEAQRLSYRSAKGKLLPTISAEGGVSTNFSKSIDGAPYTPFPDQFRNKRGEYMGVSLSIPIFSGFARSASAARGRQQLAIVESRRDQTLRTLYSEIEQAVADMNGQAEEYRQAHKQSEAMAVAHDVNVRKYQEGLVSALDLNTSANRLMQARVEEKNAQMKFFLKQRLVNFYNGVPFISEIEN